MIQIILKKCILDFVRIFMYMYIRISMIQITQNLFTLFVYNSVRIFTYMYVRIPMIQIMPNISLPYLCIIFSPLLCIFAALSSRGRRIPWAEGAQPVTQYSIRI